MATPQIVSVSPDNGSEGITLNSKISVVFDQEIDIDSVQIMVEGADTDRWSGPDQAHWDDPSTTRDDDILSSPGYKGIIAGTLSFEKVDISGNSVSSYDFTGGGSNWCTKVVFTPSMPLAASQGFRVYIPGDENDTDGFRTGVSSRTVFDTVKGSNLGNGNVYFTGSYTGTISDVIRVSIKTGNIFEWRTDSSPLIVRQLPVKQTSQLLTTGIYVHFDGITAVGDTFSVVIEPAVRMVGTYTWIFTTGSGNIRVVPENVSTSIPIGGFSDTSSSASGAVGVLSIISTTPRERATNLDPHSINEIRIKFNKTLDPTTITDETIEVYAEPVNGVFEGNPIPYTGNVPKVLTVEDDTLIITFG